MEDRTDKEDQQDDCGRLGDGVRRRAGQWEVCGRPGNGVWKKTEQDQWEDNGRSGDGVWRTGQDKETSRRLGRHLGRMCERGQGKETIGKNKKKKNNNSK